MPTQTRQSPTLDPRVVLARTTTEGLLTAAYALTHRIHAQEEKANDPRYVLARDVRLAGVRSLRAQRDLITAEILSRVQA